MEGKEFKRRKREEGKRGRGWRGSEEFKWNWEE